MRTSRLSSPAPSRIEWDRIVCIPGDQGRVCSGSHATTGSAFRPRQGQAGDHRAADSTDDYTNAFVRKRIAHWRLCVSHEAWVLGCVEVHGQKSGSKGSLCPSIHYATSCTSNRTISDADIAPIAHILVGASQPDALRCAVLCCAGGEAQLTEVFTFAPQRDGASDR